MTKRFTGYHATAILAAFFAVVIAVNVYMARMATSTFGGILAENGYVASQDYNKWIAESAAQDRLGWHIATRVDDGHLRLDTKGVTNPTVQVVAEHPLGREDDRVLAMVPTGSGSLRSATRLPEGRWKIRIRLSQGGHDARYLTEVRT